MVYMVFFLLDIIVVRIAASTMHGGGFYLVTFLRRSFQTTESVSCHVFVLDCLFVGDEDRNSQRHCNTRYVTLSVVEVEKRRGRCYDADCVTSTI
jgi:hypothetical protein